MLNGLGYPAELAGGRNARVVLVQNGEDAGDAQPQARARSRDVTRLVLQVGGEGGGLLDAFEGGVVLLLGQVQDGEVALEAELREVGVGVVFGTPGFRWSGFR